MMLTAWLRRFRPLDLKLGRSVRPIDTRKLSRCMRGLVSVAPLANCIRGLVSVAGVARPRDGGQLAHH